MHDSVSVFGSRHATHQGQRADMIASFDFLLAFLAVFAWLGIGSIPGSPGGGAVLALFGALTLCVGLFTLWEYAKMPSAERQMDWLPLMAGLSSIMVAVVLFAFYSAGAMALA